MQKKYSQITEEITKEVVKLLWERQTSLGDQQLHLLLDQEQARVILTHLGDMADVINRALLETTSALLSDLVTTIEVAAEDGMFDISKLESILFEKGLKLTHAGDRDEKE